MKGIRRYILPSTGFHNPFSSLKVLCRNFTSETNGIIQLQVAELQALRQLKGKSLMRIDDYSPVELNSILKLSHCFKALREKEKSSFPQLLHGTTTAAIYQKRSTRTRVSSETGIGLLGGKSLFLSSEDIQLGVNETIKDTAIVLSRYTDLILARVFEHQIVEELKQFSTVPVINALSDMHHPLQTLADFMTMQEQFGMNLGGKKICWIGDGNNVLHDIMLCAPILGIDCSVATPSGYEPHPEIVKATEKAAEDYGTVFNLFNDPLAAVKGAHVVFTDTWISMGQESSTEEKLRAFEGFQVTFKMMKDGDANPDWRFMHCLPRHSEEVDDEVFYSNKSLVFEEAENRMYTLMAVACSMLGEVKLD